MNADGYYLDYTFIEALEKYFWKKYGIEININIEEDWCRGLKIVDFLYSRKGIPVLSRIKIDVPFPKEDSRAAQFVADKLENCLERELAKRLMK